jgi:hypothetical protein
MKPDTIQLRIPIDDKADFLEFLNGSEDAEGMVARSSEARSLSATYSDIFVTLASAGSLTALASIVKTWLQRSRSKVEVVDRKSGRKVTFEGPLEHVAVVNELQQILKDVETSHPSDKVIPLRRRRKVVKKRLV